jgi:CheY-like chemotaxis protein
MKDLGVLVVDDNCAILSLIERLFSHFKVKVVCVGSATEALDRLKTKDCKTMITNVDLPGMGGLELTRKARELLPDLNVVLFTGNTTEQVINLALAPKILDIFGVHIKPCGLDDMLMSIMKQETGKSFLLE